MAFLPIKLKSLSGLGRGTGMGVVNVTPTPQMQQLAQAIQTEEGYAPGTVSYTNNNPGNLVYAGQPGATPGPNGFAVFDTYADGQQALYNQLNLYANGTCGACGGQPLTISEMTQIYAPAGQGSNNPTAYASYLAGQMGVSPDTELSAVIGGTSSSSGSSSTDLASALSPDSSDSSSVLDLSTADWGSVGLAIAAVVGVMLLTDV